MRLTSAPVWNPRKRESAATPDRKLLSRNALMWCGGRIQERSEKQNPRRRGPQGCKALPQGNVPTRRYRVDIQKVCSKSTGTSLPDVKSLFYKESRHDGGFGDMEKIKMKHAAGEFRGVIHTQLCHDNIDTATSDCIGIAGYVPFGGLKDLREPDVCLFGCVLDSVMIDSETLKSMPNTALC